MLSDFLLNNIAETIYEALRVWDRQNELGEETEAWADADEDTKNCVVARVKSVLTDPRAGDATFHNKWVADMHAKGWSEGKFFDEQRRTDPLMVGFFKLPHPVQARERFFRAAVLSLSKV